MPSSAFEFCMVLESSRPPSTAALCELDFDFIAGSLLMPTECGRALQNSNWKLNLLMARRSKGQSRCRIGARACDVGNLRTSRLVSLRYSVGDATAILVSQTALSAVSP